LACEALQCSNEDTASAILESANLQPLASDQADQAYTYDERGFKYDIPLYCVYNPSNLLRDPPAFAAATSVAAATASAKQHQQQQTVQVQVAPSSARGRVGGAASDDSKQQDDAASSAASPPSGKSVKFKVRFSNGLPDLVVDQRSSVTIASVKALIAAAHPSLTSDRIRLYYLGKLMASGSWSLHDIGMKKEMVLQCFVPRAKD
jgi:hypothetical protein